MMSYPARAILYDEIIREKHRRAVSPSFLVVKWAAEELIVAQSLILLLGKKEEDFLNVTQICLTKPSKACRLPW